MSIFFFCQILMDGVYEQVQSLKDSLRTNVVRACFDFSQLIPIATLSLTEFGDITLHY